MMIDIVQNLLNEKRSELLEPLVQQAGFSGEEASSFLPPALAQIVQSLSGGGLDLGALLGSGGDPAAAMERLDVATVAREAGVEPSKAQSGLQAILPMVLSFAQDKLGTGDLDALIGGGEKGGVASALGGLASKLFKG
jgi:hypothetical protein